MAFDYKKAYKEYYLPETKPEIVTIPAMNYLAVHGKGDPNQESGEYQASVEALYSVAFTIKMSKLGGRAMKGYFDYVMPPLEGFWWQPGQWGIDYARKDTFHFLSCIRLPEFVTGEDFAWAVAEAQRKKKKDFSSVEFLTMEEGLCVQMMHIGPFDKEPQSVAMMDRRIAQLGYVPDFSSKRLHHEIYLSDPRKVPQERWKTVIRHPIRVGQG